MHHGIAAVKPAVQTLEAVHEALGCRPEICLPVLEFIQVDAGPQALFIQASQGQLPQGPLDHRQEFSLLVFSGVLGRHSEIRLEDPVVIAAHDVVADPRVQKRLL